jgi:hypothetical protein
LRAVRIAQHTPACPFPGSGLELVFGDVARIECEALLGAYSARELNELRTV